MDGKLTFRFRHDLQFIDSRGSELTLRAGKRSMPTCGRCGGRATGWTAGRCGAFIALVLQTRGPRLQVAVRGRRNGWRCLRRPGQKSRTDKTDWRREWPAKRVKTGEARPRGCGLRASEDWRR